MLHHCKSNDNTEYIKLNNGVEKAAKSIDESLRKLQTEYFDLLLIHQAYGDVFGTWRAMEKSLS